MACYDDSHAQKCEAHTRVLCLLIIVTLTSHDDLLGRQPTPTRDEVVHSCPHSTREVPEGSGMGSQTRYVQAIVTRVFTSQVVQDGGPGEQDQRPQGRMWDQTC